MSRLDIYMLQTPRVLLDGNEIAFPYKKTEALFYYIATEQNATRDFISSLLWENSDTDTARKNLRHALYMLKKVFGTDITMSSHSSTLSLSGELDVHCDLYDFLNGDMTVYKMDFLNDFFLKKSESYEEWLLEKREYFRSLYLVKLYEHIRSLPSSQLSEIEILCSSYTRFDPYDERIALILINAYRENHLYLKGIQAYQKLHKLLESDLGIVPGKEISTLYNQIRSEWAEATQENEPESKHVIKAHEKEVRMLNHIYKDFLNGKVSCVMISGENGIGKTTLIKNLTDSINQDQLLFLETYCYQAESENYLSPWNSLMLHIDKYIREMDIKLPDSCVQVISQFFPTFGDCSYAISENFLDIKNSYNFRALSNSIVQIFSILTSRIPVMIVIDNLQFSDVMTLRILQTLLFQLNRNFLVISTSLEPLRPQIQDFASALHTRDLFTRISLKRFTVEDMQEIISLSTNINDIPKDVLTSIYKETAGNAFFLNELLNTYKEKGDLSSLSANAKSILSSRLVGLSTPSRQLLDILSLFHNYASLELLSHVHGRSAFNILELIEELKDRALIREQQIHGDIRFSFTHGKMREFVYQNIPPSKRRVLYNSVASILESILPDSQTATYTKLARYFSLAGNETKVLKYQIYPFESMSVSLFELYPSQNIVADPEIPLNFVDYFTDIETRLLKNRGNFTDPSEFDELYARLTIAKGRYYILSGLYCEGLESIKLCFSLPYIQSHPEYLLKAYRQMIYYGIQLYQPKLMQQYLEKGLLLASENNFLMEQALFLRLNGLYELMCNNYAQSECNLRESISILKHHSIKNTASILNIAASYNYLGELERKQGHFQNAVSFYQKAISLCEENNLSVNPTHYTNLGRARLGLKQMEQAEQAFFTACSLYDNSNTLMERSVAKSNYAVFLCQKGNFKAAQSLLSEASKASNQLGSPIERGLLRKIQAELVHAYPDQCRRFLPESYEFYIADAKRLLSIDTLMYEFQELAKL